MPILDPETTEFLRDHIIQKIRKLAGEDLPELAHTIEEMELARARVQQITFHEQAKPY